MVSSVNTPKVAPRYQTSSRCTAGDSRIHSQQLHRDITDSEIRDALSPCVASIVDAIKIALERTPPELSADISDRGVVLTGGGALLRNLDTRISRGTGLPVMVSDDPLLSVVRGAGKMLDDFSLLRRLSMNCSTEQEGLNYRRLN